jgi:hypothetical protein
MTQPNVYFTLTTPFVTIIGLYDNVVDAGYLDDTQQAWLIEEMRSAPADLPLLITSHHPMLSLDKFHGPSEHMQQLLDEAVTASGRTPTCIFAGHVHNYQRWEHVHPAGDDPVPFIVSGGGGYWNLHGVQARDRRPPTLPYTDARGNRLLNYADNAHSYTLLTARADEVTVQQLRVDTGSRGVATSLIESITLPRR